MVSTRKHLPWKLGSCKRKNCKKERNSRKKFKGWQEKLQECLHHQTWGKAEQEMSWIYPSAEDLSKLSWRPFAPHKFRKYVAWTREIREKARVKELLLRRTAGLPLNQPQPPGLHSYIFSRGSYEPSFATTYRKGGQPNIDTPWFEALPNTVMSREYPAWKYGKVVLLKSLVVSFVENKSLYNKKTPMVTRIFPWEISKGIFGQGGPPTSYKWS